MDLIIIGAGGFAKEIAFLTERIDRFRIIGFVDDNYFELPKIILGYPVLGSMEYLKEINYQIGVVIGISNPQVKEYIYNTIKQNENLLFPNIIDNTALIGSEIVLGMGNVIMPYTTFSASIEVGNFNMINIHSTIGHDNIINDYNSIYPNVNISGNVLIDSKNEFGVGAKIIPNIHIGSNNIIGAGSVVIKNIKSNSKLVGVPAKIIESWE